VTVGVPLDLPQTQAKSLEQDKTPLQLSVDVRGKVFINDTEVAMADLIPKLKAITDARGGMDERIYMRADKKADYGRWRKYGAVVRRGLQAAGAGNRSGAGILSG
jgi:Biopolymer transport protein